jgi:single-stranded-DNA-specific exonuclease
MSPTPKRWEVAPPVPRSYLERFSHLNPIISQILYNRLLVEPDDVDAFLTGRARLDDPFRMLGIRLAVERIRAAVQERQKVVVYGDFDADGVTATALLVEVLNALGADVEPYIPHRVDEGYGLNCDALDKITQTGARLVVTVDCGIRSPVEVAYANRAGLDMIVTDHHSIARGALGGEELPPALAVINPRRDNDPYPFKDFAGVGVAFKLAQALLLAERESPVAPTPLCLSEQDLLDLVALGTVADLAPLLDENRWLVQRGLAMLNQSRRPGVQAMLSEAGVQSGRVDAAAIGFVLGPRINAAGRLSSAVLSYQLLTAPDLSTAVPLAAKLGQLNRLRQKRTLELVGLAKERIVQEGLNRYLYLVGGVEFPSGIVGLVAGKLAEDLYRPVLVVEWGETTSRGSARSIPEFDITRALDACRDLLVRHGGHAAAAGFTVANENLGELRRRLEQIAESNLADKDLLPKVQVDAEVGLAEMDWAVAELLAQLEPFGNANLQPVFASLGLEVVGERVLGQEGQHLKLTVRDPGATGPAARRVWDAIAFRQGEWFGQLPPRVDLAYSLEINEFNGKTRLQLNVRDIRPTSKGDKK